MAAPCSVLHMSTSRARLSRFDECTQLQILTIIRPPGRGSLWEGPDPRSGGHGPRLALAARCAGCGLLPARAKPERLRQELRKAGRLAGQDCSAGVLRDEHEVELAGEL